MYQKSRESFKLSNTLLWVVCSLEFSCAHHGEADIKQQCDNTKSDTCTMR